MMCCNGVILASNSKVVAVIHARMSSSRFPGKMLALLGGMPVLEWVVRRTMCAEGVHRFVLATSDLRADDVLATLG
ncbi:MAG: cytidylyltransferase domain-containing protein, partial [Actinomycetota bacterium]